MPTFWDEGVAVAEVVAPVIAVNNTTGYATLSWEPARRRTVDVPIGTWVGNGVENFDVTKVTDTEVEARAFNWLPGAGTSQVTLGLGDGLERYFRGVRLCFDVSVTAVAPYRIRYSADGSTWFTATPTSTIIFVIGTLEYHIPQWDTPASAVPRDWQIERTSGSTASICTEAWFFEFEAVDAAIEEVRIYDAAAVCLAVPGGAIALPLNVTDFITFQAPTYENGGTRLVSYDITVRVFDGTDESIGTNFTASQSVADLYSARSAYVRQSQEPSVSLASGTNNNLPHGHGPGRLRLVDPGGNFTITGFDSTGLVGGEELIAFHEETRQGTFSHDSGSSLSGNRMKMYPGANVTMTGPFEVHLRFVAATPNYWRYEWGRSSGGFT
jgi:hypothetical protein